MREIFASTWRGDIFPFPSERGEMENRSKAEGPAAVIIRLRHAEYICVGGVFVSSPDTEPINNETLTILWAVPREKGTEIPRAVRESRGEFLPSYSPPYGIFILRQSRETAV